jgi:hypothetical protein
MENVTEWSVHGIRVAPSASPASAASPMGGTEPLVEDDRPALGPDAPSRPPITHLSPVGDDCG